MSVNADVEDWGGAGSNDSGERAWLLQSPSVDSVQQLEPDRRSSGVSSMGAVFIVVNAALGAGLLNFPAAFNMAGGVTAGVVLQMFMLIFIISGLVILGYCSQVSNEATYQEVVRATCGKVTGVLCEVAIAVYTFGTCIAFFIVIGDQLDRLIAAAAHNADGTDSHYWYTDRKFTIAVTAVIVILPLSIPKEIGFQKYASALSVMGTWYVTIVVIIKYIWPDKEVIPGYIPTSSASWTAVFNAMPTICFGFQCHVSSVPVFNSMRRKEIKPWGVVVTFSMIICLFVYTGTAGTGWSSLVLPWLHSEHSSLASQQQTPSIKTSSIEGNSFHQPVLSSILKIGRLLSGLCCYSGPLGDGKCFMTKQKKKKEQSHTSPAPY
uniref:Sodium-coupled neutral amino acid transporter 7 n=1 Tax=Amphilophus citrinellus TaxID=61819 RepID=A0A3Q0QXX3_AMPCI